MTKGGKFRPIRLDELAQYFNGPNQMGECQLMDEIENELPIAGDSVGAGEAKAGRHMPD